MIRAKRFCAHAQQASKPLTGSPDQTLEPTTNPVSKTWFGFQITADVTSKLFGTYGRARVSRTSSFLPLQELSCSIPLQPVA